MAIKYFTHFMFQFRVETILEKHDGKMWMNKELTGKKFHRFGDTCFQIHLYSQSENVLSQPNPKQTKTKEREEKLFYLHKENEQMTNASLSPKQKHKTPRKKMAAKFFTQ